MAPHPLAPTNSLLSDISQPDLATREAPELISLDNQPVCAAPQRSSVAVVMEDSLLCRGIMATLGALRPKISLTHVPQHGSVPPTGVVVTTPENRHLFSTQSCVVVTVGSSPSPSPLHVTLDQDPAELLGVVRSLLETSTPGVALSSREAQILSLVARGRTTADIAEECYLSPDTVKTHLARIYKKLGAPDRAAAVFIAVTSGMIPATL